MRRLMRILGLGRPRSARGRQWRELQGNRWMRRLRNTVAEKRIRSGQNF